MKASVNVMTYQVRKFPSLDEDSWFDANREFVASELGKYKDLFKEEELNVALRELLSEYLFLHNLMKDVTNWRGEFLRYLAHVVETAEHGLERKDDPLDKGRLSILRDILQWF
jgi:hypothetical protein